MYRCLLLLPCCLVGVVYAVDGRLYGTSENCTDTIEQCLHQDKFSRDFYCLIDNCVALSYPGFQNCLTEPLGNCSRFELRQLQHGHCTYVNDLTSLIISLPKDCQDTVGDCLNNSPRTKSLYTSEKQCAAMLYSKFGEDTYRCIRRQGSKCSDQHYEQLWRTACGASAVLVTKWLLLVICLQTLFV